MFEYRKTFKEGLALGLRKEKENPRNTEALVISQGAVPSKGVLRAIKDLSASQIDTSALAPAFPYPQVFVTKAFTIVCFRTAIYEYKNGALIPKVTNVTPGATWTLADYTLFMVLTNGAELIVYQDGVFRPNSSCEIPPCLCLCDVNGQMLVGAPGTTVPADFTGV